MPSCPPLAWDAANPFSCPTPTSALTPESLSLGLSLSGPEEDDDPNCTGCRATGEICTFSLNCRSGNICNRPDETLHDPAQPDAVCIQVACANDADCQGGEVCTVERVCERIPCQSDTECAEMVCLGGACRSRPSPSRAARCEILPVPQLLRSDRAVRLRALAFDAEGIALPGLTFEWSSSDVAISIDGDLARATGETGSATIEARTAGGIACSGSFTLTTLDSEPPARPRVAVIDAGSGAPLAGAMVTIELRNGLRLSSPVDERGVFESFVPSAIAWVAAAAEGHVGVVVLEPGTRDLMLPLPPAPRSIEAGGFRGAVSLLAGTRGDFKLARVGASLRTDVLDLGLARVFCATVPTMIDLPELGAVEQTVDLAAGAISGIGSEQITTDPRRCADLELRRDELGCFLAEASPGADALWTFAGRLQLATISSNVSRLCDPTNLCGTAGGILDGGLSFAGHLAHGVNLNLTTALAPKVPSDGRSVECSDPTVADASCIPDDRRFTSTTIAADQAVHFTARVRLPLQPNLTPDLPTCARSATLISGALVPGRGLVPLGFSRGRTEIDERGRTSCEARSADLEEPLGPYAAPLEPGELPLYTAAPHGGLEGSPLVLMLLAHDAAAFAKGKTVRLAGILHTPAALATVERFDQESYLPVPSAELELAQRTITLGDTMPAGNLLRLHLGQADHRWVVYLPASTSSAMLPEVIGPLSKNAALEAIEVDGTYAELFAFGSERPLEPLFLRMKRFTQVGCSAQPNPGCHLE
ncbi:MAG: hypothetical protein IT384_20915 [Deltaproteobacteria bacterium]|nr:hypothetical protein [Deltaproteobacteria bacterium]